jgi:hypothetical protein
MIAAACRAAWAVEHGVANPAPSPMPAARAAEACDASGDGVMRHADSVTRNADSVMRHADSVTNAGDGVTADPAKAKREANRVRARRWRANRKAGQLDLFPVSVATSRDSVMRNACDVMRNACDSVTPPPQVFPLREISNPLSSPTIDADAARAPPAKSMITPEANALADDLMRLQRLDADDPRCIGTAYTAQAWLTKGWDGDVIRHAVGLVMSRIPVAPRRLRYFEMAIAEAHAERDRKLPVVNVIEMEAHTRAAVRTGPSQRKTMLDVYDDVIADFAAKRGL